MSGGSWEYAYIRLDEVADELMRSCPSISASAERRLLGIHLKKVARALHDIEWVDSCDYGKGDERKAIQECLEQVVSPKDLLHCISQNLRYANDEMKNLLNFVETLSEAAENEEKTDDD